MIHCIQGKEIWSGRRYTQSFCFTISAEGSQERQNSVKEQKTWISVKLCTNLSYYPWISERKEREDPTLYRVNDSQRDIAHLSEPPKQIEDEVEITRIVQLSLWLTIILYDVKHVVAILRFFVVLSKTWNHLVIVL